MRNIKTLSLGLALIFTVGVGSLVIAETTSDASGIESVEGKKDKKKCCKKSEENGEKKCCKKSKECKKDKEATEEKAE